MGGGEPIQNSYPPRERLQSTAGVSPACSPPHVFIQKCEHIGLPTGHAEIEEAVPLIDRVPEWWVDLQAMRLAELLTARIQLFACCERVVVGGE